MNARIITHDKDGYENGWLLPLWNVNDRPDLRPDQVYLTTLLPRHSKGPHLHKKREQRYYCIRGEVSVAVGHRLLDTTWAKSGCTLKPGELCIVPAGYPSQLFNHSDEHEAWIINMPSPAWSKDDQDEWPVEGWLHE